MNRIDVIDINPENISDYGIFCVFQEEYCSGIKKKIEWFKKCYKQGLRMKMVQDDEKELAGFIEYVPGEYAWRTVNAKGYTFIHCLQIRRGKVGSGYGSLLLNKCLEETKDTNGAAIVTSSKPYVNDKRFFQKQGFKKTATAPPYFELLVRQFKEAPLPSFINGWEERAAKYKDDLTVIYSDQCAVIDSSLSTIKEVAREFNIPVVSYKINNHKEAQLAPSPYGVFNVIYNGKFLTHEIVNKRKLLYILRHRVLI